MRHVRRLIVGALVALMLALIAAPAYADASPPTNGGNSARHSGQGTGNPDDRPSVCPGT